MRLSAVVFSLAVSSASAFQCPPDWSERQAFEEAENAYLIYVSKVEYAEDLTRAFLPYDDVEKGYVKLLEVTFAVKEVFKGSETAVTRIFDLAGIGTGFVGFIPGYYYIVSLKENGFGDEAPKGWPEHATVANLCDIAYVGGSLSDEHFSEDLKRVRSWSAESEN